MHEHDHARALGGFWVSPSGQSHPVDDKCHHYRTIKSLGYEDYDPAYREGWLRVTFCDDGIFGASWWPDVTVAALRTLAQLLRYYSTTRQSVRCEQRVGFIKKPTPTDPWNYEHYGAHKDWHDDGPEAGVKVARRIMRLALEKNAASRRAA